MAIQAMTRPQGGFALIEGLVAVLIFSFGILAAIGLQATSVKAVTAAKERLDASLVANEQIGRMWSNPTSLTSLNDQPVSGLPNGRMNVTVTATADPDVSHVEVVITWRSPGAAQDSRHRQALQISKG